MDEVKQKLIERAIEKHKKIFPCGNIDSILDCFTVHDETLVFWFNTEDNNTRVLVEALQA